MQQPNLRAVFVLYLFRTPCSCLQNRTLNLQLEKEKHKVAKLQQALSQAAQGQQVCACPAFRKHTLRPFGQHESQVPEVAYAATMYWP